MPTTFLDMTSEVTFVGGEQGLLSMAFAPDYATSHRFYVYYTSKTARTRRVVTSTSASSPRTPTATAPTRARAALLTIPHPAETNHNGGQLQFGPDGDLYISVGDGGGGDDTELNAQHTTRCSGKILRIAPATTPYAIRRQPVPPAQPRAPRPSRAPTRPRSGPTACATRGGSRSTAPPATW